MPSKKKLQVFVSSTYTDLIEERQAAVEAILTAGHIPAGMELFAAGDESQMDVIKRWIDESDVYLLILGGRYGSIEPRSQKSYVQLEYEYALEINKPMFSLVINEKYLHEKVKKSGISVIEMENQDKLKIFRSTVLSKICRFWDDFKEIKLAILETMADFSRREELKGWIPGDEAVNSNAVVEELSRLAKENSNLREQLAKVDSIAQRTYSGLSFDDMVSTLSFYKINVSEIDYVSVVQSLNGFCEARNETNVTLLHLYWVFRTQLTEGVNFQGDQSSLFSWFKKLAEIGLVDLLTEDKNVADPSLKHVSQITLFKLNEIGIQFLLKLRLDSNFIEYENYAISKFSASALKDDASGLPETVDLMEMLNIDTIDRLREFARENWRRSMDPKFADWLYAPIGLLSGNDPRVLSFSARADGVHGIIVGSTGSGKSELLMTIILSLALNFSPDVLNFVLIDYRGGSAFYPFEHLPHKVEILTNLDQPAIARFFDSILAELDRRQKLNTYTNSKDIVHYRKKGLNLEPDRPPYPHLFIIIDEFAEMISGNAVYMSKLESIARLGRALGVSLLLATYRPLDVINQLHANIKFRLCLRVTTPDDSREVLRRSDAAFLPPGIPGRGYLKVGDEDIEMIQTAYAGGDYRGPKEREAESDVIWLDRPRKYEAWRSEHPKLYDVIIEMLNGLAMQDSKPQWRPWPEPLPSQVGTTVLSLQTPLDTAYMTDADIELLRATNAENTYGFTLNEKASVFWEPDHAFKWNGIEWGKTAMRSLVGIVDNPNRASQTPLMVNFPNGHAAIFGASGRGKTTFLRTIITSLALTHSPDELHIYILDFGARALTILSDLPHIGAIITSDEEERVMRILRKVNDIIDYRQALFSEAKVNSLDSYHLAHPEKIVPAVLVVIDNFSKFKEYYEGLTGALVSLVREARAYGVHFLFSADQPNALDSKLLGLVTERFALKLSNPNEYLEIVGRGMPADFSSVPGRGYVRVGDVPLEFQTALTFSPTDDDADGLGKVSKMCLRMKEIWGGNWKGEKPSSIKTLHLRYALEELIMHIHVPEIRHLNAMMGIDDLTLEPVSINIERQGPHMVIIGQPLSGKTTTLRTMLLSIAYNYSPDEVMMVLVDYSHKFWKGNETSLADLPHVLQTINEVELLDEFYENLSVECAEFKTNPKRRKIMIFIDNYDVFVDETSYQNPSFFEKISALVRKYQTAGVNLIVSGSLDITSNNDALQKVFSAPKFGIALKGADAVGRLNGKFPRSLTDMELPMGRAFIVRSGITSMLQLATPYANDDDIESSLDAWVRKIKARYPQKQVAWLKNEAGSAASANSSKAIREAALKTATPVAEKTHEAPKYNLPKLKKQLIESGLTEETLGTLSESEMVEHARAIGLLDQPNGQE